MKKLLFAFLISAAWFANADTHISAAAPDAKAYIISPADGAVVNQQFKVVFGLSQMGVAPAGVEKQYTGHHHLLIDMATLPDVTKPLPVNEHVKHFGGGQTEAMISLPPGQHTLQLLLGNHLHVPHDKPVLSEKITITVK